MSARPRAELSKPQSVKAFKAWLAERGAEVLPETNVYELVRFRTGAGLAIIYSNDAGRAERMTGEAEAAWTAFKNDEPIDIAVRYTDEHSRPIPSTDAALVEHAAAGPITIAFVMGLDLVSMREAHLRLDALERAGRLVRGHNGRVLTWEAVHVG